MGFFDIFVVLMCSQFIQTVFIPSFDHTVGSVTLENDLVVKDKNVYETITLLEHELAICQASLVPAGTIVAFSGDTPPPGWAECDGTQGTPDLRDRFIMGRGPTNPDILEEGGATTDTVSKSKSTASTTIDYLRSHTHTTYHSYFHGGAGATFCGERAVWVNRDECWVGGTNSIHPETSSSSAGTASHSHAFSVDHTVKTVPPYRVLIYIMKL